MEAITVANRTKQTTFKFAPIVKQRLRKLAHYQGIDMVFIVSALINKEYMDSKEEIEQFIKDHPIDIENEENE
jgi:tRNA A37 threonylcarbamoyladenosine dehydratase